MSAVTIECPECHAEHTRALHECLSACGQLLCPCGVVIEWTVRFRGGPITEVYSNPNARAKNG